MKDKIQEVHDYFKNKIINGDYKSSGLVKNEASPVKVIVDDEYLFDIWIGNGADYFDVGGIFGEAFMELQFTPAEKKKAYNNISSIIKDTYVQKVRQEKLEIYERLKKEFEGSC